MQLRADGWIRVFVGRRCGRLSIQVLTELYTVLTRKLRSVVPALIAREIVRALFSWNPVAVDSAVLERGWILQVRCGVSWWDTLIVAAARLSSCSILLTEDLQHNEVLEGVRVIDPFVSPEIEPARILSSPTR